MSLLLLKMNGQRPAYEMYTFFFERWHLIKKNAIKETLLPLSLFMHFKHCTLLPSVTGGEKAPTIVHVHDLFVCSSSLLFCPSLQLLILLSRLFSMSSLLQNHRPSIKCSSLHPSHPSRCLQSRSLGCRLFHPLLRLLKDAPSHQGSCFQAAANDMDRLGICLVLTLLMNGELSTDLLPPSEPVSSHWACACVKDCCDSQT